jgi:hypothetical protein
MTAQNLFQSYKVWPFKNIFVDLLKLKVMNISQALKEKNKLVKEINQAYLAAINNNSIEEGNTRKYSVSTKLNEALDITNKLVDLKTKIQTANVPVQGKIFLMAELKGRVEKLKILDTAEGKQSAGFRQLAEIRTVEIDVVKRDTMVKELEDQISALQDELDTFNATTQI